MKIFGNNFELEAIKFLYTRRILVILKEIQVANNVIILTPFTRYSDIFNFKKENPLFEIMEKCQNDYKEKIINEKFLVEFVEKVNQFTKLPILDYNLEQDKAVKSFLNVLSDFIDSQDLAKILKTLDQFVPKRTKIVIAGFEPQMQVYPNLDILYLIDSIKGNTIKYDMLETLWIDNIKHNKIFEVEDQQKLLSWLELETKSVITNKQLNNYLSGVLNYDSYLIDNSFKKISYLDI